MCARKGDGTSDGIPQRLQGVQKFTDYEMGWDNEFKQAVGKRLYNKLKNAQSTQAIISALQNSGFKQQMHGTSGRSGERHDISFAKEQNGIIEQIAVTTRTRWESGERLFWLDQASYSWHKLGD